MPEEKKTRTLRPRGPGGSKAVNFRMNVGLLEEARIESERTGVTLGHLVAVSLRNHLDKKRKN